MSSQSAQRAVLFFFAPRRSWQLAVPARPLSYVKPFRAYASKASFASAEAGAARGQVLENFPRFHALHRVGGDLDCHLARAARDHRPLIGGAIQSRRLGALGNELYCLAATAC